MLSARLIDQDKIVCVVLPHALDPESTPGLVALASHSSETLGSEIKPLK